MMRITKKIGLFVFIIIVSCNNSSKSKKPDIKDKNPISHIVEEKHALTEKPKDEKANDSIIPFDKVKKYDTIISLSDGISDANHNYKKLELVRINNKIGFMYESGEELFPCNFDSVVDVKNNYYSMVNGQRITTKGYFSTSYNDNRYAKVENDGKWGLISIKGEEVIPNVYEELFDFDYTKTSRMEGPYIDFLDYNGKAIVAKKNGKWGIINIKGEVLVDFIYDEFFIPDVKLFYENRIIAKKDDKWGVLNEKGTPISSFIYDTFGSTDIENPNYIYTFKGGVAVVKKGNKWGLIDINGNEKTAFIYDYISHFVEELTIAQKNKKWGYINKKGDEVIPLIYDEIKWFERDLCPVKKDDSLGFINRNGDIVIPLIYNDILISEEVAVDGGLWFFSQDGYCAVKKNGKWGLIDDKNNVIVHFEYDSIKFTSSGLDDWRYFYDGFLSVQKGEFWSVINKEGLNKIPFDYNDVSIGPNGYAYVKKNNKWGLLDSLGTQLVTIKHESISKAASCFYKNNKE